ncbi:sugar phosphate isomerase/epimerase [Collinsella tanakaei]|uniref:sugar phosphate isomerase/epimerase family protein n=1 Tax=Collinsella tanakaei TaxID=626935 RepID=UPI00195826FB|nr:sugar phosphate isomerase/epimerase family protein [Collinsella tanakaei]MBM6754928.1 sugar phosphate isomerase/epimerase [Collinsella tanakaei]
MGAFNVGVRLHDLPEGTVEERLHMAAEQGFSCLQLPSKVLYASYGIDCSGLTRELAEHLRALLDELGLSVAVFGCYKNLVTPDAEALEEVMAEYEACLRFAAWLGGCPVGTETGRPNAENAVADDRFSDDALWLFCARLGHVCAMAEQLGVRMYIEPGWNEVVCTPERCRYVLDVVASPALGVIYDPVSLLHPKVVEQAQPLTARMLRMCGERIHVIHAKDYTVELGEDGFSWTDGSGSHLVCHGAGTTGAYDMAQLARWASGSRLGIDCVVENSTPDTAAQSLAYLQQW